MKKLLTGISILLSIGGYSQSSTLVSNTTSTTPPSLSVGSPNNFPITQAISSSGPSTAAAGDTVFIETFGNGIGGDGTNGTWTNSGGVAAALWEYRGTSTTPDNTIGSRGAFAGTGAPISSNTTANGFFIFDSDYLDNNGSFNLGSGIAPSPHKGYLTSPTIDLTGYTGLQIQLTNYYRRFQSDCYIEFSINGGTTWPYSIHLYGGINSGAQEEIAVNQYGFNGSTTLSEIPAAVTGNSNVKFRLVFDGTPGNANGNGYYYWIVDDIIIKERPDHDLVAQRIYFNGVADSTSGGYYYAEIPKRQADLDTILLGSTIYNNGNLAQTNVKSKVLVNGVTNGTILSSGTIASIASGAIDSIDAGILTPNSGQGNYDLTFIQTADSTDQSPLNDSIHYSFDVSYNRYAWTNDYTAGNRPTSATSSYEVCSKYTFNATDTVIAMQVQFEHDYNSPNTPSNLQPNTDFLTFRIIDADLFNSTNAYTGTNIAEYNVGGSIFYAVQSSDVGNLITVPVYHNSSTPNLTPGDYFACVKTYNPDAFISSDAAKSSNNWREGTTITDTDDENDWGGFMITPSIAVITKAGSCNGTSITANINKNESSQTNGSITAVASGGLAPYSYAWTHATSGTIYYGSTINGLNQAGTYNLTITDLNGCQNTSYSTNLGGCVGLQNLMLTSNTTNASSATANDGAIDLILFGGSTNFSYAWSGPNGYTSSQQDITSLTPGTYTITVTDLDCAAITATQSFIVSFSTNPCSNVTISSTFVANNSSTTNGTIAAIPSGGTPPYAYIWTYPNGTTSTTNPITGLNQAGTYQLVITDANGCQSSTLSHIIGGCVGLSNLSLSTTKIDASGPGLTDGSIDLTVTGGSGNFNYNWSGLGGYSATTQDINTLGTGNYQVIVTDTQCQSLTGNTLVFIADTLNNPCSGINLSATFSANSSSTTNGSITASPSGGSAPYAYSWTYPNGTTSTANPITGLNQAGVYQLVITDANGCQSSTLTYNLGGCVGLSNLSLSSTKLDASAPGLTDGAIDLTVTGGSGSYSYLWTGPMGYSATSQDINSIGAGSYTVTVTDAQCTPISTALTETIVDTLTNTNPCSNSNINVVFTANDTSLTSGSISAQVSGGTAPYQFAWALPNGSTLTGNPITGLTQTGNYQLVVVDANGCTSNTFSTTLGGCIGLSPLSIIAQQTDVSTPGANDGAVDLTVSGGSGNYSFNWSNSTGYSATTEDVNNLQVGFYFVTVSDTQCASLNETQFFYINNFHPCNGTNISATVTTDETSQDNGSITALATGGTPPYTYDWTYPNGTSETGATIDSLNLAGNYQLVITDSNGCQSPIYSQILAGCVGLTDLSHSYNVIHASASGVSDGSIDLTVNGGSNNYSYVWVGPNLFSSTSEDISFIPEGTYYMLVRDVQCTSLSIYDSISIHTTGIDDLFRNLDIRAYPNPNLGSFQINLDGLQQDLELSVKNIIGQTIHTEVITTGTQQHFVNLTDNKPGIYLVEFKTHDGITKTIKMIIE